MNKYIRTILVVVLITISYIFAYGESNTNDVRNVLTELKEVIKENPAPYKTAGAARASTQIYDSTPV